MFENQIYFPLQMCGSVRSGDSYIRGCVSHNSAHTQVRILKYEEKIINDALSFCGKSEAGPGFCVWEGGEIRRGVWGPHRVQGAKSGFQYY